MNKLTLLVVKVPSAKRFISTSCALAGKRNFRKFYLPNQRPTKNIREQQKTNPNPDIPIETYGTRRTAIIDDHGNMVEVPELIPELIVPDLTGFDLLPYVSYRSKEFTQSEFTPEDLFNAAYSNKIVEDWNKKALNEDGSSKNPSEDELLEPEQAVMRARQTGSDIFGEKPKHSSYDMYSPKPDVNPLK